jgi:hypothetical protein
MSVVMVEVVEQEGIAVPGVIPQLELEVMAIMEHEVAGAVV